MKIKILINLFILSSFVSTGAYADFGKVTQCSKALSEIKEDILRAKCRVGHDGAITLYAEKEQLLYIDRAGRVSTLIFNVESANKRLDHRKGSRIEDITFNENLQKWVIYKPQNPYYLDIVYLLDKNYDPNVFVHSFLIENNKNPLSETLTFEGSSIKIKDDFGKIHHLTFHDFTLDELKKRAYNSFEMSYLGWKFIKKDLGDFPAYSKVSEIFKLCSLKAKKRAKDRCFKREGRLLQDNLYQYVKSNPEYFDPDLYETETLLEYLGEERLLAKENYVIKSMFRNYQALLDSEVFNLNFNWLEKNISFESWESQEAPNHQVTYHLNSGLIYFSIGQFAYKPRGYSIRYAYYPIEPITWD